MGWKKKGPRRRNAREQGGKELDWFSRDSWMLCLAPPEESGPNSKGPFLSQNQKPPPDVSNMSSPFPTSPIPGRIPSATSLLRSNA